jgi:hypothetical protein
MISAQSVRRGLRFFLAGRLLSGLLGVVWLAMLVRALEREQLGVYFGFLSLFEVLQLASSVGVYSYTQRFLPASWVSEPRAVFQRMLIRVFAWRLGTLLAAAALLGLAWSAVVHFLDWPLAAIPLWLCLTYLLVEGMARFCDVAFECTVQQGVSQSLSFFRNALRISALTLALHSGSGIDAAWVFTLEVVLAATFVLLAVFLIRRMSQQVPDDRPVGDIDLPLRRRFALEGYLALALGQLCSVDAIKLIVSHMAGPGVLAVYGLASSLVDVARRYMPAFLFQGFVRAVLTAQTASGASGAETLFRVRLLMRVNGIFLAAVAGWLAVCGESAVRAFTARPGFGDAAGYLLALMLVLFVQAVRLMGGLVAHIKADNRSVLWATVFALTAPVTVYLTAPVLGGMGAVLGVWVLEITYGAVLLRRLHMSLADLCGTWQFWARLMLAALVSMAAALIAKITQTGALGVIVGTTVFAVCFALIVWRWVSLAPSEVAALRRLVQRQP